MTVVLLKRLDGVTLGRNQAAARWTPCGRRRHDKGKAHWYSADTLGAVRLTTPRTSSYVARLHGGARRRDAHAPRWRTPQN